MANGNAANVEMGPGWFYVAPLGTTEPADCSTALPSAWRPVGYTEEGWTWTNELTSEDIEVAEELEPIDTRETRLIGGFAAQLAEVTRGNLALAMNVGANAATSAASLEPPALGSSLQYMGVWDKFGPTVDATNVRRLFRKIKNVSNVEIRNQKAPNKSLIAVEFRVLTPDSSTRPWKTFPDSTGLIA